MINPILRLNYGFIIPFLLFVAAGTAWSALVPKVHTHLSINAFHTPMLDQFIPLATWSGDGWVIAAICVLAFLVSYRAAILLSLANLFSSGITQLLKHFVFEDTLRPYEVFRGYDALPGGMGLHLVPGVEMFSYSSFPSGHATIAFASCFCLAVMTKHQLLKFLLFFLALFAGYTRIYLSQHFFEDVLAGAVIGTVSSIIIAALLNRWVNRKQPAWIDHSLLKK